MALGASALSSAGTFVSVTIAPPALPVYVQPVAPGPGYIWTPGYWAYGPDGYYWVPGVWVIAPYVGALWTPGYWGWGNGVYVWHAGYWGTRVGFYGGVNYGYGYTGYGYHGGYWNHGTLYYNRAVTNVDVTRVHNTYYTSVNNAAGTRVSYHGGPGGTTATAVRAPAHPTQSYNAAPASAAPPGHAGGYAAPAHPMQSYNAAPAHAAAPGHAGGNNAAPVHGNTQLAQGPAPHPQGHGGGQHPGGAAHGGGKGEGGPH